MFVSTSWVVLKEWELHTSRCLRFPIWGRQNVSEKFLLYIQKSHQESKISASGILQNLVQGRVKSVLTFKTNWENLTRSFLHCFNSWALLKNLAKEVQIMKWILSKWSKIKPKHPKNLKRPELTHFSPTFYF